MAPILCLNNHGRNSLRRLAGSFAVSILLFSYGDVMGLAFAETPARALPLGAIAAGKTDPMILLGQYGEVITLDEKGQATQKIRGTIGHQIFAGLFHQDALYAFPSHTPIFQWDGSAWHANPLPNRGKITVAQCCTVAFAVGRHVYASDAKGWVRIASAPHTIAALATLNNQKLAIATTKGKVMIATSRNNKFVFVTVPKRIGKSQKNEKNDGKASGTVRSLFWHKKVLYVLQENGIALQQKPRRSSVGVLVPVDFRNDTKREPLAAMFVWKKQLLFASRSQKNQTGFTNIWELQNNQLAFSKRWPLSANIQWISELLTIIPPASASPTEQSPTSVQQNGLRQQSSQKPDTRLLGLLEDGSIWSTRYDTARQDIVWQQIPIHRALGKPPTTNLDKVPAVLER